MNHRREHDGDHEPEHGEKPPDQASGVLRGSAETRRAGDLAFGPPPAGPQWPGRVPSEAELNGVSPTDTQARTPLGVGTSTSRRGERIAVTEPERGRRAKGTRGRSGRPYGTSDPEHDTGVAPQRPRDPRSPHLPTGDQAG
jgi:hypothetical protein